MRFFHTLLLLFALLTTCDRDRDSIVADVAVQHYKANVKVLAWFFVFFLSIAFSL